MDEKSLYAHILNLSAPWQVHSLSLDEKLGSVTVIVGIAEHTQLTCPTCGKSCSIHDHRRRKWRHLDTCQFTTLVEADVPRVDCPEHGCQTLPVPWAGPGSRYTLLFEAFVLSWLKVSTVDAVADDVEHAIELANTSDYGLGGNLWTSDVSRPQRIARRLETGGVFINGFSATNARIPVGGVKKSGYGRELSHFGLREFTNAQAVWAKKVD
ncbi:aldehyde dehydrogenase family protein [Rahnella victoriana]|uniref:Aldehyde dehydrogenase family protein n=1 Tax=Rahnella victoriana TaxID=1510570 RepID=A0ABS0DVC6_9GAMM|nr:aldehyde dehydrogenase family protein [Rahnella victoriana]MBF7957790.1 aldehyde dehydrogenase family protein [Rahnella victoriana]